MSRSFTRKLVPALAILVTLAGCQAADDTTGIAVGVTVPVSQVIVRPKVDTIFTRDTVLASDTVHLRAVVVGFSGTVLTNPRVRWSTPDTSIVTVDTNGVVRPRRLGTATVIAKSGDKKDQATVVVAWATQRVAIASPALTATGLPTGIDSIFIGDEIRSSENLQLRAQAIGTRSEPLSGVRWQWRSSNPAAATVDSAGVVRPIAFGATTISATGAGLTATRQVTVLSAIRQLNLTPPVDTILAHNPISGADAVLLQAIPVLWPSAHAVALHTTWRTSNPAVASVDSLGLVRARGIGAATVSATMAGVTQSSSIVVRPAP